MFILFSIIPGDNVAVKVTYHYVDAAIGYIWLNVKYC